jgi:phenylpropionate dioxygenase-like ring-hydroxylating dioxygenase large terminal subunit
MAEVSTTVASRTEQTAHDSDDASTLPYAWYVDPDRFEQERQRIFSRTWQYVGHVGGVAAPGDFFTTQLGGLPVVITRDEDGELHALRNVCCHRGAEVVLAPEGNRKTLQCHYHAWSYGLDGRLVGAPRSGQEPGFRKEDFGLRPLRLETYGPFIFVNPDDGAPPLHEVMGELPAIVAQTGVDLDALRCHERREYPLRANWKVVVENFLECYHCQVAHPSFADAIDLNSYEIDEYRYVSTQHGPPKHDETVADQQVKEGRYNYLWPTFMLNIYPGPGNASTNQIVPIDADNTLAVYEYFYEDGASDDFASETTGLIHQVMVEDITLCESVQRGMRTGTFEHGRLMLRYEHAIRHFQNLVRESLAA